MDFFWWTITIGFLLIGLVGTFVPLLPGTLLIFVGTLVNFFTLHSIGWPTVIGLTFLMLLAQALDFMSGAVGGKWFGATRWGAIGGILGAVVGIFFGLPGIILGPLIGALFGELLSGQGILPAGKSSWGTFLGTTAGLIGKVLIGVLMVILFTISAVLP
jgi:uncharacterized protein